MKLNDDEYMHKKVIRIEDNFEIIAQTLTLADVSVQVRHKLEDTVEDDCSFDSEFVLDAIYYVGATIHKAYHLLPDHHICYLVIDNDDGHRTNENSNQYQGMLLSKYKIELIFQVP